ncbi:tyrosine-type recombinase/integrase [Sphingobium sp. HDIP04]|uniref:tyrosine-type recombinase/integrase n=1 Tax=Sphingobium sp. HDIP04 TaxID=428994 RepID=UPI0004CEA7D7|nr:tyrosine-type recombinase/integrase [Sphingobium sp. HDIP04]
MRKKRRRRYNAHLPEFVSPLTDRHGKVRLRYRRKGYKSHYFKAEIGTPEFLEELRLCNEGAVQPGEDRTIPGTIAALIASYVSVPSRLGPTEMTQRKIRNILDKFREEYGAAYVRDIRFDHIEEILEKKLERRQVGKRLEGGPEAAKKLRKELVRLFDFAIKMKIVSENPASQAERVKAKAGTFHTWTEEEIAQYRAHHDLGTKARLALELILWTAQRKGDAFLLGPADLENDRFGITQGKTGKAMRLSMAPQLRAAIDAMPPEKGDGPYLRTSYGKAFQSAASFGNWFRKQCNDAGLPKRCSAHGLRKAMMRRGAERGLSQQQLKSMSGHSRDEEVRVYTQAANQEVMNAEAVAIIAEWESLTLASNRVSDKLKPTENGEKP